MVLVDVIVEFTSIWAMLALKCERIMHEGEFLQRFLSTLPRDLREFLTMSGIRREEPEVGGICGEGCLGVQSWLECRKVSKGQSSREKPKEQVDGVIMAVCSASSGSG